MELVVDHMLKAPAVRNNIAKHLAENDEFARAMSSILDARRTDENQTGDGESGWRKGAGKGKPRIASNK